LFFLKKDNKKAIQSIQLKFWYLTSLGNLEWKMEVFYKQNFEFYCLWTS